MGCLVSILPLELIQNHSPGMYAPYKKGTCPNNLPILTGVPRRRIFTKFGTAVV